LNEHYKVMLL